MSPSILVTGRDGQLGFELRRTLAPLGAVHAIGRNDLDLRDLNAIRMYLRELRPDVVVNAAAYTAVDRAEADRDTADLINASVPGVLAEQLSKSGGKLMVHYSSDYVFEGRANRPYTEDDPTDPLNAYGKSKLAGERLVQDAGAPYIIMRTAWLYAMRGANFVRTILRLAQQGKPLHIVSDQVGAPTWARMVAEATAQIVYRSLQASASKANGLSGIYHVTAAGQTSWHGFSMAILQDTLRCFEALGRPTDWCRKALEDLLPISTADYPTAARRPAYSVLSNEKVSRTFKLCLPDWRDQLRMALEHFCAEG
jgi:dTDP-4-dehydrorhamnose reductase